MDVSQVYCFSSGWGLVFGKLPLFLFKLWQKVNLSTTRKAKHASINKSIDSKSTITIIIMLGVEGYGSGSDNDSDVETSTTTTAPVKPVPTKSTTTQKSGFSLPPPKQAKRPKKIPIDLPKPGKGGDIEGELEQPPSKKARTDGKGAGASSLLSMLPAPKQKAPAKPSQPKRVLGGGNAPALSFNSAPQSTNDDSDTSADTKPNLFMPASIMRGKANVSTEDTAVGASRPLVAPFTPAVDFFSLGTIVTPI